MTASTTPKKRAPRGVLSNKPVYMRLMPDERHKLDQLSTVQNQSTSSVARQVFLEGIEHYENHVMATVAQAHTSLVVEH
jgi:hypothetical protein